MAGYGSTLNSVEVFSLTARWTGVLAVLFGAVLACGATEGPFLYALEGVLSQVTDYTYTLTMEPGPGRLEATVPRIGEVDQPWYKVRNQSQDFAASEPWDSLAESTDRLGNSFVTVRWVRPGSEVRFYRRVRVRTDAVYGPIVSGDPYPIPRGSLPLAVYEWLGGSAQVQVHDREIRVVASSIVAGARAEIEAVARILGYIRENVRYACGKELCEPVYRVDALATLERGIGNCVCYANLALAFLRAAGIPAKYVTGFVADREESRAAHAWISVYVPTWGWVEFESSDWMPASGLVPRTFSMPEHITISLGDPVGITPASFSELHEASFEVIERPARVDRLRAEVPPGRSVSWFVAVSSPGGSPGRSSCPWPVPRAAGMPRSASPWCSSTPSPVRFTPMTCSSP